MSNIEMKLQMINLQLAKSYESERLAHERTKHLLKQGLQYILEVKEKHYPNTDNSLVDGWIKDVKELLQ